MKSFNLYLIVLLALAVGACSTGTNLTKMIQDGEKAYQAGNYQKALDDYETVIADYKSQGKVNECPVFYEAAASALQLGMADKALEYFEQNRYTPQVNGDTYIQLSTIYREKDNLSKELDALETYLEKYPGGEKTNWVHERLFGIFVEIEEWDRVIEEYGYVSGPNRQEPELIEGYFLANKALDNDTVCDRLASEMLAADPENLLALDWMAKKYFWKAEDLYQAELRAYDKNKTNKQYNRLLRALDEVSADFKTALGYFKTCYKLDPNPKTARYLGNIYNRLDDQKKADYYYKLAE